jgi:hypothetical protein
VADKRIRRWSAHIARPHFYTIFTLSHLALWVNYLDPAVMEGGTGYIQTTSRWWPSSLYSCWLVAAHNGNQIGAQFLYRYRQWLKILDQHSKKMGPPTIQKGRNLYFTHTHILHAIAGWKCFSVLLFSSWFPPGNKSNGGGSLFNCNSWNMYRKTFETALNFRLT